MGQAGVVIVPKKSRDDTLIQIVETQAALRVSIEQAKDLADQSEKLIKKHRDEVEAPKPSQAD